MIATAGPSQDPAGREIPDKRSHLASGSAGQESESLGEGKRKAKKQPDQAEESQEPEIDLVAILASKEYLEKHYSKRRKQEEYPETGS